MFTNKLIKPNTTLSNSLLNVYLYRPVINTQFAFKSLYSTNATIVNKRSENQYNDYNSIKSKYKNLSFDNNINDFKKIEWKHFDMSKGPIFTCEWDIAINYSYGKPPTPANVFSTDFNKSQEISYPYLDGKYLKLETFYKPAAVYFKYLENEEVTSDSQHTIKFFKGSPSSVTMDKITSNDICSAISDMDINSPVTTGYGYPSNNINPQPLSVNLWAFPGENAFFQDVVLYSFKFKLPTELASDANQVLNLLKENCKLPKLYLRGDYVYFFVEMTKKDPFNVFNQTLLYKTLEKDQVSDYLMSNNGFSKWAKN
ncbi:hypothetical protein DICPUDRAFT_78959 [Dictyostelium purpureum]|uniref:Monalysin Pore-forming domain-containing protein n=1 Tax=Dictyostelium purpureum TaxID=5786 RepID=F0ZL48_DICPU|nr:uncharacterized protein DICPUDRAFT_78959 [Dictyostelium purpureum]EGC35330.1 hypothetical protein DICPUDRAFT_78959 [Dictyostelium purpureum]|eukprot:XP_003288137.1 hypothetical protein DICPUDRAFT_78959 [Dictyostelium purpureum]